MIMLIMGRGKGGQPCFYIFKYLLINNFEKSCNVNNCRFNPCKTEFYSGG